MYNYGRSGAGNQFITNMICQADAVHNFNEDDLIIICWTNVSREDRYKNQNWITPGNIYSQNIYDENYVKEWADPVGYLVRDLASIRLARNLLENKKSSFHMMSMCNLLDIVDQGEITKLHNFVIKNKLKELYKDDISAVGKDFYTLLWKNDLHKYKFPRDRRDISEFFNDGHPTPIEHFEYLDLLFPNTFTDSTRQAILAKQDFFVTTMKRLAAHYSRMFTVYELDYREKQNLLKGVTLVESMPINII